MSAPPDEPRKGRADPDNRARTHLANERTFLAWLRTGLSMIALGLGAAQFLQRDLIPGFPIVLFLSSFLVTCGIVIAVVGGVHQVRNRERIERGEATDRTVATPLLIGMVVIVGILAMVLVIVLDLNT